MGEYRKVYRKLASLEEVFKILYKIAETRKPRVEEVLVEKALGRVLAENIRAVSPVPPFSRALMDGYAVFSSDTSLAYEDRPVKLKLVNAVKVGEAPPFELKKGECAEIDTGAPVPYPADAVIPVEYTRKTSHTEVEIYRRVAKGENIDLVGSDVAEGEVVAWKGEVVTPQLIGVLISAGVTKVKVYSRPRVTVIPIGNELAEPGIELEYGKIYDSNSFMIAAALKEAGAEVKRFKIVKDSYSEIKSAVNSALKDSDIVVTIGGTSAGLGDLTYRVFSEYKPGIIVHGLKVSPGRPTVIALAGDKILFGLPGFPVSCLNIAKLLLIPLIRILQGASPITIEKEVEAELLSPIRGVVGLIKLVPAVIAEKEGRIYAYPLSTHSGALYTLYASDGFIVVPENAEYLAEGAKVSVKLFSERFKQRVLFAGSHCPLAIHLLEKLKEKYPVKVLIAGSLAGLNLVGKRIADIAGAHLYDPASGEYNIPYVEKYGYSNLVVVRGYLREQGFVYCKNLKVESFTDIIEKNLRFINRNRGSGTRALIEELVKKEAEKHDVKVQEFKNKIRGFEYEVKTHEAVGYLISRGVADVGVAIRYIAEKYNLGFTKISTEIYDFILSKDILNKKIGSELVQMLDPSNLNKIIVHFPGYSVHEDSGKVIYEC
ncbi:MAG: molybdopterin biosynthesis protein [Thermoprotei archaeon]|nr:MAG: molybdopterin biosynthesis protein [Thermoprotei archaeon]